MKFKIILISLMLINCKIALLLEAQQVNTLYFMEDNPVRHFLNPSFQPSDDFYISLPVIGFTQLNVGNNSLSIKNIIYNDKNNQTSSYLNSPGNVVHFCNILKDNTLTNACLQTNLLSVGFRNKSDYWTFSLSEKIEGVMNVPKEFFQLALFENVSDQNIRYDFSNFYEQISMYTEGALGYSKRINENWLLGGKLKLLIGAANLTYTKNKIFLDVKENKWTLNGDGNINFSGPVQTNSTVNNEFPTFTTSNNIKDFIQPAGLGAGIDAGFEYKLNNKVKLSAAITDLGFITWTKNSKNFHYGLDYSFNGIKTFDNNVSIKSFSDFYNQLIHNNGFVDTVVVALNSSTKSKIVSQKYTTFTTAKLNMGYEYSINNSMSIGMLSYLQLYKNNFIEELTASLNTRPFSWLNASISYSLFNGRLSTIGAGVGLRTGSLNWFLAADYISFNKSNPLLYEVNANYPNINMPLPYNSTNTNVSFGMNLVFNKKNHDNQYYNGGRNKYSN